MSDPDSLSPHPAALSEQRFRAMLGATCDIVWDTPVYGEFRSEQPGWSAFTGQGKDAYMGAGWLNAVHPDDRAIAAGVWRDINHASGGNPLFQAEYRLRHADGGYRHMLVRATPVYDADGALREWVGAHTDVSERKRAEDRLRLAMNGGMGTWDLDLGTGLMSCSDACKANFGYAADDHFHYQQLTAALAGNDVQRWRDTVHHAIASASDFDIEVRVRWPDDSIHWAQMRGSCSLDAAGSVIGLSGISLDQTERKRTEQVLHDTLARQKATLAAGEVATWTWDIAADKVIADRNMGRLFLGTDSDSTSAPLQTFLGAIHPDDLEQVMIEIEQAIGQGTPYESAYRVRGPDRRYRSVIARGRAEYGDDGAPVSLPGVILDVTRQKQAEDKLRASEERYRSMIELMGQGFCEIEVLFDQQGQPYDYRYLDVNSAFVQQSGLSDAVGKSILEMMPGHDSHWAQTYGRVVLTGEPVRLEDEAKATGRWFDVYAVRLGGPGSTRLAVLFTDITERKKSERQLRELAEDLSEMDRRKTEFLATLAHELRNPLAPIRNGLQIMRMAADNPATVARVRDVMERQVNQMVHLVNDLLDVARITRGQIELKKQKTDLKSVVSSAVETSLPLIDSSRHQLKVDLDNLPLPLDVDPTRLAQVLGNLLNNAAKYTPPGGQIALSARRDGSSVLIAVSDSGVGIPPESLATVFDMFTQVGQNMGRSQGGLGIGLSLVRRLVELHGGSVSVASPGSGLGSTFTVRLPLADSACPVAILSTGDSNGVLQRNLRILVVDDNIDAAETLAALLGMMGHAIQVANDGPRALKAAGEFQPDVMFLDIGMPGMSGYDVARALRNNPHMSKTVLVALTGWGAATDRHRSSEAGFDHHLTKPANIDAINQLLGGLVASSLR
ncbi:hybrid sensor histidine kinase/response regulator [Janthinobacterium agaricidamnosum]|uniref:histidine kinase n=1 Tax=Janthinobacterium agaricidamnosum NBRC 102515 = DSM 9628 TaxID=1349767 RepID=W0VAE6_9BURK|nr:PAS domain-containing protein [Janthinobacterium agaricidamnosum]CDG84856.1 sensory box protein [Janthinobacterium agaricidamnosum NBRC 102515 = DSM 9628]